MNIIKPLVITLFILISFNSKAQYYKLLNLTEKEVREKITEYPIVVRDSSKHEFIPFLFFKNKNDEWELRCNFFNNKCYSVDHFSNKKSFKSAVREANEKFTQVGENRWISKDSIFEISIQYLNNKVFTHFSRGISKI